MDYYLCHENDARKKRRRTWANRLLIVHEIHTDIHLVYLPTARRPVQSVFFLSLFFSFIIMTVNYFYHIF